MTWSITKLVHYVAFRNPQFSKTLSISDRKSAQKVKNQIQENQMSGNSPTLHVKSFEGSWRRCQVRAKNKFKKILRLETLGALIGPSPQSQDFSMTHFH